MALKLVPTSQFKCNYKRSRARGHSHRATDETAGHRSVHRAFAILGLATMHGNESPVAPSETIASPPLGLTTKGNQRTHEVK